MFLLAVVIVALATLFLLTALALGAAGQLAHPYRAAVVIAASIVLGLALLIEYAASNG